MTVDMAIYTSFAIYTVVFFYGFLGRSKSLIKQKDVTLFLDETGLPAALQKDSSRLKKINKRLFIDQEMIHHSIYWCLILIRHQ